MRTADEIYFKFCIGYKRSAELSAAVQAWLDQCRFLLGAQMGLRPSLEERAPALLAETDAWGEE